MKGGLSLYIYTLLKLFNKTKYLVKDYNEDFIIVCILISQIGYVKYYIEDNSIFTISEDGKTFSLSILALDILIPYLKSYNILKETDKKYYKQCVAQDSENIDKNIKYVQSLANIVNCSSL